MTEKLHKETTVVELRRLSAELDLLAATGSFGSRTKDGIALMAVRLQRTADVLQVSKNT